MAIEIKKQTKLIFFYILYFVWLTSLTFISPDVDLLTHFSIGILVFYFLLLREKWDWLWFLLATFFVVFGTVTKFENWDIKINYNQLREIPYWLPLAWGTTALALRKFYLIMSRHGTQ